MPAFYRAGPTRSRGWRGTRDERTEAGLRVDEPFLAERPVDLLARQAGDPEFLRQLQHGRHACPRRVGAVEDPLPDHRGDLAPSRHVGSEFDHLTTLGMPCHTTRDMA